MAKAKEIKEKEVVDLSSIKDELKVYINEQIKKGISDEIEKSNKRIIREKNKKIIFKNIIILLLLALVCFLVYLLYKAKFFNKYFVPEKETTNIIDVIPDKEEKESKEEEKEKVPTLEELVNTYSYLLDNIYINENSQYVNDYYSGKLTNEIKNYISLNNVDSENFTTEDDYNIISEEKLKEKCLELFNDYENTSFDFNSNKIRYLSQLNSYLSDSIVNKIGSNIEREIINIEVKDNIVITTVEGLVLDNNLYNVIDNSQIENYNKEKISKYKEFLNTVKYTFKDGKLINIEKSE